MPSYYDSKKSNPKKSKKVKGYKKGGGVFLSSGAPIPKKTVARGSGAARTQYFRKNG
tara:strand:+ start:659 stop:829 length:171 start_codon:yes stop_codon:yes gene_type:complete